MLDSRYIHLHEALGLGAMWLKQSAKIIGQLENRELLSACVPHSSPMVKRKEQSKTISASRLAVLQKINSATLQPETLPENNAPILPKYPTDSVENYLKILSVPKARVMALSVCASPADVVAGQLLSGSDGELFTKMLAAIQLNQNDVWLSSWLKDLPDFSPKPPTEAVQAAAPRVQAEWQLCGAKALLLMGNFFERDDVKAQLPVAPTFYIPHPQRILNDPTLKRSAWETLQQLQQFLQAA